jgi:hypothetical protein
MVRLVSQEIVVMHPTPGPTVVDSALTEPPFTDMEQIPALSTPLKATLLSITGSTPLLKQEK